MKTLESIEQMETYKNGKSVFLFTADWCPDCRVIEPFMPEVEEKFADYTFVMVDRDAFLQVCIDHDVFGIPSFLAFENGEELGRFVSKDRKTQEEIEAFLAEL
ncbi:thioredoxin family protein [Thalassobacillus hwangdonensis]|uniref:Thioredoxin family protein n=1 Tax=Thalassobacillus hwangdonensis TaxID=546108 RepID=A0ABW3KYX9_9BACI